ncbi:Pyruvate oxidase [Rhodovastum atsumiense]|uniref:Pyruvate oxidase n=1 Tax=Rhodovastum atsumiense TaxID=504468 RepID=A0A5M6IPM2_9PROT|nr:thiamine pyrophosphate-dependent enzyme [Rhodovastum atsumiense]KAA5610176.1 pyruvate oxidase [Rhodovastum atsumiense]CAH2599270.1 Pyruvate oxidase [Rhodovastum atsumiense]
MAETTGDVLVQGLLDWGTDTVFGLPGDGVAGIVEALRRRADRIRFVQTRQGSTAALMASGHARLTGRLGVCLASAGPGGLQLLAGLYDARADGAPVLALTGLPPHDLIGTAGQQDVPLDRVFADACGFSIQVQGPAHAEAAVNQACRIALADATATHLTIPSDIQSATLGRNLRAGRNGTVAASLPAPPALLPAEDALARAAAVLNAGRRICILAGRGALGARAELTAIAERLAAPVTETLLGKGVLPDHSPYGIGGAGLLGTRPSQDALESCDTLLIVGSGFPYLEYYPRPGQARVVQIDANARRIGLRVPVEAALTGDAAAVLRALLPLLAQQQEPGFLEGAQATMVEWREELDKQATRGDSPMKPQVVLRELDRLAPEDAILVADCGTCTTWAARYLRMLDRRRFTTSGTMATAGCALPYAIAAALAHPGRMVVAVSGDGALTMSLGELATCVRHALEVKLLVLRNDTLGAVRWEQMVFAGTPEYGCALQPVDFAAVARAFGMPAFTADQPEECGEVIERALATPGPVLIEAVVDPNEPPMPPKVTLQQAAAMAEALARGTPLRRRIALTLNADSVRQTV